MVDERDAPPLEAGCHADGVDLVEDRPPDVQVLERVKHGVVRVDVSGAGERLLERPPGRPVVLQRGAHVGGVKSSAFSSKGTQWYIR